MLDASAGLGKKLPLSGMRRKISIRHERRLTQFAAIAMLPRRKSAYRPYLHASA